MSTILISKQGNFTAHVEYKLHPESDGNVYRVKETGYISDHEKVAINNARNFLKRKRRVLQRATKRLKTRLGITKPALEIIRKPFVATIKYNWLDEKGYVKKERCSNCSKETLILTGQYQDSDYAGILFCRCAKCGTLRNITWKRKEPEIEIPVKIIRRRTIKPKVIRRRRNGS